MSKSEGTASGKVPAEHQKTSVYDFLYCDSRRIGSYLAQFDDSGHLERVVQKESANTNSKRGYKFGLGGGATVLGTGGQGTAAFEISPEAGGSEASERIYDPLWANALTFLDYLESEDLLHRGIDTARIGQFVLIQGDLGLFDFNFLKMAWENPYLKGLMSTQLEAIEPAAEPTGNRQQRRVPSNTSSKKKASLADGVFDLLKVTPHAIVASINDGADVWCNLSEESLVGKSSDILLKHGPTVAGKWAALGILDALPDVPEMIGDINMTQINMATTVAGLGSLGAMVLTFAPMLRGILGRPNESYGITPLLIFRQVAVS